MSIVTFHDHDIPTPSAPEWIDPPPKYQDLIVSGDDIRYNFKKLYHD
jgi:hypothetical protein